MFHGEPTVGLQPNIPLSRRVQLAVLAHIRHTHTRYDQLLKETSWMNARKVVEPVCLDVLVKWRGDEETGRDQMDEILREVVIITDSEESDESSEEDDSSDEEGEITSSSSEGISQPTSRNQNRLLLPQSQVAGPGIPSQLKQNMEKAVAIPSIVLPSRTQPKVNNNAQRDRKVHRGFKRYQAAWDEAVSRRQAPDIVPPGAPFEDSTTRRRHGISSPIQNQNQHAIQNDLETRVAAYGTPEQASYPDSTNFKRQVGSFYPDSALPDNFAVLRFKY